MRIHTQNNRTKWFTKQSLHTSLYIKSVGQKIEQYYPVNDLKVHTEYRNIVLSYLKKTKDENKK